LDRLTSGTPVEHALKILNEKEYLGCAVWEATSAGVFGNHGHFLSATEAVRIAGKLERGEEV